LWAFPCGYRQELLGTIFQALPFALAAVLAGELAAFAVAAPDQQIDQARYACPYQGPSEPTG